MSTPLTAPQVSERELIISISPGETRIATVHNGLLTTLTIARDGDRSQVGSIHLGRVKSIHKGLQAAFVDYGQDRDGFLSVEDVRPFQTTEREAGIETYLQEGDAVRVEVQRDAVDGKGAKLSHRCTLNGSGLVFKPGQPGVQLSKRINGSEQRARLKQGIAELCPPEDGFIIRTAAQTLKTKTLVDQARSLIAQWQDILHRQQTAKPPQRLSDDIHPAVQAFRAELAIVTASNTPLVVRIDDADVFAVLKSEPASAPGVQLNYDPTSVSLFEACGVEEQIEQALAPSVILPGGGSIHIQHTRALIAIDVDTGATPANTREQGNLTANMEAVHEIARQIVLRNLSGQILIDLVPLKQKHNRDKILQAFRAALQDDPSANAGRSHPRSHVLGLTQLGLIEMTRRREGKSLSETLCTAWQGETKSSLTIALEALRHVLQEAALTPGPGFELKTGTGLHKALNGTAAAAVRQSELKLATKLRIILDETMTETDYQLFRQR